MEPEPFDPYGDCPLLDGSGDLDADMWICRIPICVTLMTT